MISDHVIDDPIYRPGTRFSQVAADCFLPLFKREIGPAEFGFALVESVAHLNCLLRQGRVSRSLSEDGAWLWQAKDPAKEQA